MTADKIDEVAAQYASIQAVSRRYIPRMVDYIKEDRKNTVEIENLLGEAFSGTLFSATRSAFMELTSDLCRAYSHTVSTLADVCDGLDHVVQNYKDAEDGNETLLKNATRDLTLTDTKKERYLA